MEQKETIKLKRPLWSVYILLQMNEYIPLRKFKKPRLKTPLVNETHKEYLYLDVTKLYKKDGMVHVCCGKKEHHMHDLKRVVSIQVREYDRSGRIV